MTKICITTQGCSLNVSDTEVMKGVLVEHDYTLVHKEQEADIIILNSCTVKSSPEQRVFYKIRNKTKPLIIAGCVPQADPHNEHFKNVSIVGPKALTQIAYAVKETLQGNIVHLLEAVDTNRNNLPTIQTQQHIGIIPINAGCLGNCSYCKTKQARGHLESYPVEAIEKQFRNLINKGTKEIWLTSQDTAAYGLDIQTNLSALLKKLLQKTGDYRIRLGMANPQHLIKQLPQIIEQLKKPNMFHFLHLPLQSGSNKVLQDMQRGYTVEQYKEVVNKLKKALPDITIATDIIVGFPTETEKDFEQTINLLQELQIPVVNISKFYPRPNTKAATLKKIPTHKVKERSTKLKHLCEEIAQQRNKEQIGKTFSVIIDEKGKNNTVVARTNNYIPTILKKGKIGERQEVTITKTGTFDIRV